MGCASAEIDLRAITHLSETEDDMIMELVNTELDEQLQSAELVAVVQDGEIKEMTPQEAVVHMRAFGSQQIEMVKKDKEEKERKLAERVLECPGKLKMRVKSGGVVYLVNVCASTLEPRDGTPRIEPVYVERSESAE